MRARLTRKLSEIAIQLSRVVGLFGKRSVGGRSVGGRPAVGGRSSARGGSALGGGSAVGRRSALGGRSALCRCAVGSSGCRRSGFRAVSQTMSKGLAPFCFGAVLFFVLFT